MNRPPLARLIACPIFASGAPFASAQIGRTNTCPGTLNGGGVRINDLPVILGLFGTGQDFGPGALDGNLRRPDTPVRAGARVGPRTRIIPRVELQPVPYAIRPAGFPETRSAP